MRKRIWGAGVGLVAALLAAGAAAAESENGGTEGIVVIRGARVEGPEPAPASLNGTTVAAAESARPAEVTLLPIPVGSAFASVDGLSLWYGRRDPHIRYHGIAPYPYLQSRLQSGSQLAPSPPPWWTPGIRYHGY